MKRLFAVTIVSILSPRVVVVVSAEIAAAFLLPAITISSSSRRQPQRKEQSLLRLHATIPSWQEIEQLLGDNKELPKQPRSIDSVLSPTTTTTPTTFSTDRPTLFRERHGWCPYSERVWLALELAGVDYDTVRIDNTGGPRPSYFSGQTPQMKWPNGGEKFQGESMDLVYEIEKRYGSSLSSSLSNPQQQAHIQDTVNKFQSIFPRARPSSRAAYLFQSNGGEPLSRSTFQQTLQKTDELLKSQSGGGPFFCGSELTAADVAWAPFLERYRYQLPCLHEGLNPDDAKVYPHLSKWYHAMDQIPVYACRVKGDASSWRKVLTMAGFGNAGLPPAIQGNMQDLVKIEQGMAAASTIDLDIWKVYASTRPYVSAKSPHADAASIIARNRQAILQDTLKRATTAPWNQRGLPETNEQADKALRALAAILLQVHPKEQHDVIANQVDGLATVASFLDERMCVPRDMGAMSAATIKTLSHELSRLA
jgi:glutathione S-transferase